MTELVPHPQTGQPIDISRPDDELAQWLDQIIDFERMVKNAKDYIGEELLSRMDSSAKWTLETDHYVLTGQSPAPTADWKDPEAIQAVTVVLNELFEEGVISSETVEDALKLECKMKAQPGVLKKICKLSPEVEQRINSCVKLVDKRRRVSVKLRRSQ